MRTAFIPTLLNYIFERETPRLERSGGSMGAGASAKASSAGVKTGLADLYVRMSNEVWLKRNVVELDESMEFSSLGR